MLLLQGSRIVTRAQLDKLLDTRQIAYNRSVNKSRPHGVHVPDWRNSFTGIAEHFRGEQSIANFVSPFHHYVRQPVPATVDAGDFLLGCMVR
jgi:hypothetical protein